MSVIKYCNCPECRKELYIDDEMYEVGKTIVCGSLDCLKSAVTKFEKWIEEL